METEFDALEAPKRRKREHVGKAREGAPVERAVQREIVKGLRKLGIRVVHIPNGVKYVGNGLERARQAAVLRADGLVPGFVDLVVIKPGSPARVGFIEVKREGGVLSDDQIAVRDSLKRDGADWDAVCTFEGALNSIRKWGWL